MKILHTTILVLTVAVSALLISGCNRESSRNQMTNEVIEQIRSEIAAEISKVNTDSLSDRVIYIQPTVVNEQSSSKVFNPALLIPICGIVIPFAAVISLFWVVLHYRRSRQRDKYKLIEYSIRNGQPLPDSFYLSERPRKNRLQSGIVWLGVGVALIVWGLADSDNDTVAIEIIPLFVGIARIITYFIDDRKNLKAKYTEEDTQQD